jgi:CheY-like chemotaxis protein
MMVMAKPNHDRPRPQVAPVEARPAAVPHILLADDDADLRELIEVALRAAGFRVTVCPDGLELVDRIASLVLEEDTDDFDLILSDIRMPGVSGLEVLEGMHRWAGFPPMILMTAFGDPRTHSQARSLGARAIIDKPFSLDELVSLVRRYTGVPPG